MTKKNKGIPIVGPMDKHVSRTPSGLSVWKNGVLVKIKDKVFRSPTDGKSRQLDQVGQGSNSTDLNTPVITSTATTTDATPEEYTLAWDSYNGQTTVSTMPTTPSEV